MYFLGSKLAFTSLPVFSLPASAKKGFDPTVSLSNPSAKKFLSPNDSAKKESVGSDVETGGLFCGVMAFPVEGLLSVFPVFEEVGIGRSPSRFGVSRVEGLRKDLPAADAEVFLLLWLGSGNLG